MDILAQRLLALHPDTPAAIQQRLQHDLRLLGDALAQGHTCLYRPQADWPQHPLIVAARSARDTPAPLVADGTRLYLYRQWQQECQLGHQLAALLRQSIQPVTIQPDPDANPRQQQAITLAASQPLTLITGGPGTGKTFTLVRIVRALQAAQPDLRIALAAPTGKAAQRMQSVLAAAFAQAHIPTDQIQTAQTVHRLIGLGHGQQPRYHRGRALPFDLIVIDEGSMLDLSLASQLMDAIATGTRLIMLGDADQLAAVDAGAVLADLSTAPDMAHCRIHLHESRRFDPTLGIGQLATAVLQQQPQAVRRALQHNAQVSHYLPDSSQPDRVFDALWRGFADYVAALQHDDCARTLMAVFDRYRVLCAQRNGRFGTQAVNKALGDRLQKSMGQTPHLHTDWYQGRPVLITRNDYTLQLSNGDIGLCLADAQGRWQVYFTHLADPIAVTRLPSAYLETAFALTIHKSQGSEFEEIALLLDDYAGDLLSRELVYTAITRARERVQVWASHDVLWQAVQRRALRRSGLPNQLHDALLQYDRDPATPQATP